MKAWHFINNDRKLGYGDGREVVAGTTYYVPNNDPLELCRNGMHGSVRLIDALSYAPSSLLCRVDITGDILKGNDKICGSKREVLWIMDVGETLDKFARLCALDAVHLWDAPTIVVEYLKTGNKDIKKAAWYAARAAARNAASYAARAAAWDAARNAQNKRLTRLVVRAAILNQNGRVER